MPNTTTYRVERDADPSRIDGTRWETIGDGGLSAEAALRERSYWGAKVGQRVRVVRESDGVEVEDHYPRDGGGRVEWVPAS